MLRQTIINREGLIKRLNINGDYFDQLLQQYVDFPCIVINDEDLFIVQDVLAFLHSKQLSSNVTIIPDYTIVKYTRNDSYFYSLEHIKVESPSTDSTNKHKVIIRKSDDGINKNTVVETAFVETSGKANKTERDVINEKRGRKPKKSKKILEEDRFDLPALPSKCCSVKGCFGSYYAKGYCKKHYRKYIKYGDPLYVPERRRQYFVPSECKEDDCTSDVYARGMCLVHYRAWRKSLKKKEEPVTCSVDGCNDPVHALGYCMRHYFRFRRYGSPEASAPTVVCAHEDCGKRARYKDYKTGLHYCKEHFLALSKKGEKKLHVVSKSNTSGYRGVSFMTRTSKWRSEIRVNRNLIYLGSFDTPEDAALAYNDAVDKYRNGKGKKNVVITAVENVELENADDHVDVSVESAT